VPPVPSTSDRALLVAWRRDGDQRARETLFRRYLPFARAIARRFTPSIESVDDLEQIAGIGLLKAIDRYDLHREVAMTTYATPTIVGELRRHFRDRVWAVHVPRGLQELAARVSRLTDELTRQTGQPPTIAELAAATGRTEEEVAEAIGAASGRRAASLSTGDAELDRLEAVGEVDERFESVERRLLLSPAVAALAPRERRIVHLRFVDGLSQSQIAVRVGISQMHVSRLLRQALRDLADALGEPLP
jgi:RNA polymerase sigma-B factor